VASQIKTGQSIKTGQRYKCTVAYDGSAYHGFQLQLNAFTVQEALEKALSTMHKQPRKIYGSGRTDAGVHAKGQVFHFDSELDIEPERWTRAFNTILKRDIRILETVKVEPNFHARFNVRKKEYRYFIQTSPIEDPFRRLYAYHVHQALNLTAMQEAAQSFLGEHDFTAFSSAKSEKKNRVRTIYRLELIPSDDEIMVICEGNGFLYNMVRIMVGTLIEIGQGKKEVEQVQQALIEKDRNLVGQTVPAHGLTLWQVTYDK
jgi:tRNA pseudouridine38-40 synthase